MCWSCARCCSVDVVKYYKWNTICDILKNIIKSAISWPFIYTYFCTEKLKYKTILLQPDLNTVGSRFTTFVVWRFTFTTIVVSNRALPTCGASLSQLRRPFSTQCASSAFPLCMCFSSFHFSAVPLSWLWFFHPRLPPKRQKRRKNQNILRYILSWCLLNHGLGLLQQNKKRFDLYFLQLSV